jgi:hypothetical protein
MLMHLTKVMDEDTPQKNSSQSSSQGSKLLKWLLVVGVLIIVLLAIFFGAGLYFTKNTFKKMNSRLSVPPPPIDASESEPIVINPRIEIKKNEETSFAAGFYNKYGDNRLYPKFKCLAYHTDINNQIQTSSKKIAANTNQLFTFIIPATTKLEPGEDICKISFCVGKDWTGDTCNGEGSESTTILIKVT